MVINSDLTIKLWLHINYAIQTNKCVTCSPVNKLIVYINRQLTNTDLDRVAKALLQECQTFFQFTGKAGYSVNATWYKHCLPTASSIINSY